MADYTSRRTFLGRLIAAGSTVGFLADPRSARAYPANDTIALALVGVSGRGSWFVRAIPGLGERFVAMCDVNDRRAADAFSKFPAARKFHDFRRMLDAMESEIDAVIVATPDHSHAVITAAALRCGKPVYCEKPLTRTIEEAREIRDLARRSRVATQMGNQGTASEAYRRAVELVRAGSIGEVREVHVWNTGGGPGPRPIPKKSEPVPDHLAWDVWLGPAEARPFHPDWLRWHGWRDFATGQLGNWASHTMNLPFRALRMDALWNPHPEATGREDASQSAAKRTVRVRAEVSGHPAETFPRWEIIHYEIPARGELPPVTLHWYNGPGQAPGPRTMIEKLMGRRLDWGDAGDRKWKDHAGCLLVGSKGRIHSTGHNASFSLLEVDGLSEKEEPPRTLPRARGHEREWLDACRGGPAAMSNFDYAGALMELALLGNVATRFDGAVEYDPVAMRATGPDGTQDALRKLYREGWAL